MFRRLTLVALTAVLLVLPAFPAGAAEEGVEAPVIAPGFLLAVEVVESNSDFTNRIYLQRPAYSRFLATDNNWGATRPFVAAPGSEITFRIDVYDGAVFTGNSFVTGSENARVTEPTPGCILIEFEDKPSTEWGSDGEPNYVDARFFVRKLLAPKCGPSSL
ncbi:MAG TPA: hypothetical protein VLA29_12795 [Acidimicrobiia bacterium]|nr:hypothetical protein [Acidimicrobiia bacterium]